MRPIHNHCAYCTYRSITSVVKPSKASVTLMLVRALVSMKRTPCSVASFSPCSKVTSCLAQITLAYVGWPTPGQTCFFRIIQWPFFQHVQPSATIQPPLKDHVNNEDSKSELLSPTYQFLDFGGPFYNSHLKIYIFITAFVFIFSVRLFSYGLRIFPSEEWFLNVSIQIAGTREGTIRQPKKTQIFSFFEPEFFPTLIYHHDIS